MSHYVETMFSSDRQVPWHSLGNVVEKKSVSKKEALKLSGTNWKVYKAPLYAKFDDGTYSKHPATDEFGLVRDKDKRILKVVGARYTPIQNDETAGFAENVLDVGKMLFVTGGSLDTPNGVIVFYCLKLPKSVKIANQSDEKIETYLTIMNPHGIGALRIVISPIRVVCFNTLTAALHSAKSEFTIWHTKNATKRIAAARDALGITYQYMKSFQKEMEDLMKKKANSDTLDVTYGKVWKKPEPDEGQKAKTRWKNRKEEIMTVWKESPNIENVRDTHYGVYNAFTEWAQWGRNFKGAKQDPEMNDKLRGEEVLMGQSKEIGEQAFKVLSVLPPAKFGTKKTSKMTVISKSKKKLTTKKG